MITSQNSTTLGTVLNTTLNAAINAVQNSDTAKSTAVNKIAAQKRRARKRTGKATEPSLELFLTDPIEWVCCTRPLVALAAFYSMLLEECVTPYFALHLTHVIIALTALFAPLATTLPGYLALTAWFALSLLGAVHAHRTQKPAVKG